MEALNPPLDERIRQALRQAGAVGLSRTALTKALKPVGKLLRQTQADKKAAEEMLRQALTRLEAERGIVNFGTAKTPRYVLREFDRRLDQACETLESKATPGKATVFSLAALRKGCLKAVTKEIVDEAIRRLLQERRLIVIQPGKSVFYLHARSIAPLFPAGLLTANGALTQASISVKPPEGSLVPPSEKGDMFSPDTVRRAYTQLVREAGFTDVTIADLRERSGVLLTDLKTWLLEQSRAGRVAPTRGDWSLADEATRAASIELRGEPHLQVRLL